MSDSVRGKMASLYLLMACILIRTNSAIFHYDHITAKDSHAHLYNGDRLWSMDGTTSLQFSDSGKFVLKFEPDNNKSIWRAETNEQKEGDYVILKYTNGVLRVRNKSDDTKWSSNTGDVDRENNGYHLVVITQCAFLIYEDMNGQLHTLWNTEDDGCKNVGCDCSGIDSYSFPTLSPTQSPTPSPTYAPVPAPTRPPTPSPSLSPTPSPSPFPTNSPTMRPSPEPTSNPTASPSPAPVPAPTTFPTVSPTESPTPEPTFSPTSPPTERQSASPSQGKLY